MALKNNAAAETPRISLIVPTYNRKEELAGLLACLDEQTIPPNQFEIIVVDDGSTDDTITYLKDLVNSEKSNMRFCCQKNSGPGAARNQGMLMARAPVFAFTDTDCRPFADWLDELSSSFSEKEVGAVGGAEVLQAEDSILMQAIHFCMTSSYTTGGLRGTKGRKLARYYPRTFNMAVSRPAFVETGGFIHLYHGEDVEFSFRIKEAGFQLRYNEDAKVYHKRRSSLYEFFRQLFKMGQARVTLARLHPGLLETLHVLPAGGIIVFALLFLLATVSDLCLYILTAGLFAAACFLVLIGYGALKQQRGILFVFLTPLIFVIQQAAYGLGFLSGCLKFCRF